MTWVPAAHSDTTDLAARPVLYDADHAPLDFALDAQDQANANAARYHLRRHVERLNALHPPKKVVDAP